MEFLTALFIGLTVWLFTFVLLQFAHKGYLALKLRWLKRKETKLLQERAALMNHLAALTEGLEVEALEARKALIRESYNYQPAADQSWFQ